LDAVEKELLQALEQEEDASESMDFDEGEKYRSNLNRIADDIRKLKNSLVATRNTIWEKNQKVCINPHSDEMLGTLLTFSQH